MKKFLLTMAVAVCLVSVSAGLAMADSATFGVSVTMPAATGVTFQATEIEADGTWTDIHPTSLNFGTLEYDSTYGIFRPTKYFVIDLGVEGGGGTVTDVSFSYTEGINPNDAAGNGRGGLGKKGTLTVTKGVYQSDDVVLSPVTPLEDVAALGTFTAATHFSGGWPRAYVGINDGANPAVGEPFTTDDVADDYLGTLTVTAVIL